MQAALNPRQSYIHESGDFRSRGPGVMPAAPAWLPGAADGGGGRLALARWLVSDQNPLTPRVTVNRMWQEFFGRGLVATEDDFGARGDRPSHPALLDWLASEFVRSGWDVKRMHRLIVTSATYRQSSRPRPELQQIDPDNILLARQSSVRVPAETVRDAALAVSGLLETKLGGPGVFPPQSERVTMEAFGSNSWKTSTGPDRYRRGLYTFILRTSPFAQSITFDAPNPLAVCTRRDRSDTPLQALTLLNDPVFAEMSAALAARIMREGGASDDERLHFAVRLCLARDGTAAEIERLQEYLQSRRSAASDAEPAATEHAAWTSGAVVLLNLHEFITRD
jgi:hypothetical protein